MLEERMSLFVEDQTRSLVEPSPRGEGATALLSVGEMAAAPAPTFSQNANLADRPGWLGICVDGCRYHSPRIHGCTSRIAIRIPVACDRCQATQCHALRPAGFCCKTLAQLS